MRTDKGEPKGTNGPKGSGRSPRIVLGYVFASLALIIIVQLFAASLRNAVPVITYSEFQQALKDGRIAEVTVGEETIEGRFKNPKAGSGEFVTERVDPAIAATLQAAGVKFSARPSSSFVPHLVGWILPTVALVAMWYFLAARAGGIQSGMLAIGKSRARLYAETGIRTSFADVAGVDEAKQELQEVLAFLKNPKEYGRLGAHVPKGILLVGPPGTGKTLLARAVAGEAGVPFLSISGSEFVEMFVGVGAARVRDLFEQARHSAPCIIFIDELDALGRARGIGPVTGGHDEKEQTLNQLLAELDGFDPTIGVVLLAATNRPEILDAALLRAGRFDRQILVDRPDKAGRVQILAVHVKKIRLASTVSLEDVAALTPGFSGADLANLVNEAAILATRRSAPEVELVDITEALERIVAGLQKRNRLLNPRERRVVAYHETGHALVTLAIPGSDVVQKVSIIPRGIGALGYTLQRPTDDRYLMSKEELMNRMAVLLGGRASEEVVFGELSTGAADDLAKATDIARSMVTRYGMAAKLGPVTYENVSTPLLGPSPDDSWRPRQYAESTAALIDEQVRALVEEACQRARRILRDHRALLEETAERLLAKETLLPADLEPLRAKLAQDRPQLQVAKEPAAAV